MVVIHVNVFCEIKNLLFWIMFNWLTFLTLTSNTNNITRPVVKIRSAHHCCTMNIIWKTLLTILVKSHVLVC